MSLNSNKFSTNINNMDETWELSQREFELRVQTILKGYIKQIIAVIGDATEENTPCSELPFARGYLGIDYGFGSEVERPMSDEVRELMQDAINEVEKLWDAQFPGIEFEIEDEFRDVNLCIHLYGQPLPPDPPADLRDEDITEERLRIHERKRIHESGREKYERAINHREWIARILQERAKRGMKTNFPWLSTP